MNKKVVSIGEILLFLTKKEDKYIPEYFCNEIELLSLISKKGYEVSFLTCVPKNEFQSEARKYIDNKIQNNFEVKAKDGRQGIIFIDENKFIKDRKYSAYYFSSLLDFDFDEVFKDVGWFHFTMDTSSITSDSKKTIFSAFKALKKKDIKVSCDLRCNNPYRRSADSIELFIKLSKFVDFLIVNKNIISDMALFRNVKEVNESSIREVYEKTKAKNILFYDEKRALLLKDNKVIEMPFEHISYNKGEFESNNYLIVSLIDLQIDNKKD